VIPKLEKVLQPSDDIQVPNVCPACHSELSWQNDFLKCLNSACRAQIEQRISHWFRTLGNADWFGIQTIRKIVQNGHDSLEKIYSLTEEDFRRFGFGPVQSKNLADALAMSKSKPVEDWRFLAAFGIQNLGTGESRKLLSYMSLQELIAAEKEDIEKINGFGEITSQAISQGIQTQSKTIAAMLSLGFNLQRTPLLRERSTIESPIAGKGIVFTGKMQKGTREEMQAVARRLGATVQTTVSRNTDYLVCGENVGAAKIQKADALQVRRLMEDEYLSMIDMDSDAR
jgi:DNA ligase (NAD+)